MAGWALAICGANGLSDERAGPITIVAGTLEQLPDLPVAQARLFRQYVSEGVTGLCVSSLCMTLFIEYILRLVRSLRLLRCQIRVEGHIDSPTD